MTAAELTESPLAPLVIATIHPSAILRPRGDEARHGEMRAFAADLARVAGELSRRGVPVGQPGQ